MPLILLDERCMHEPALASVSTGNAKHEEVEAPNHVRRDRHSPKSKREIKTRQKRYEQMACHVNLQPDGRSSVLNVVDKQVSAWARLSQI